MHSRRCGLDCKHTCIRILRFSAVLLAMAARCGWASAGDGLADAAVLGEQAACPVEALAAMRGRQISPRLPEEAAAGSAAGSHDVASRPESFRAHSSTIQRLPNGMIRKILLGKPGETAAESKRRVLKEAEYMGKFYLYRNFPRVVTVDVQEREIYMEDCGRPLTRQNVPCDWRMQLAAILHVLREHAVFHNDWLGLRWPDTPNLTETDGILYLIDFTWASTGRDSYPFMNPTEDLIERAETMWDMFKLTRDLHEDRRLRFQHSLDRQNIRRELAHRQAQAHSRPQEYGTEEEEEEEQQDEYVSISFTLPEAIANRELTCDFEVKFTEESVRQRVKSMHWVMTVIVSRGKTGEIVQKHQHALDGLTGPQLVHCTILPLPLNFYTVLVSVVEEGARSERPLATKMARLSMIDVGDSIGQLRVDAGFRELRIAPRNLRIAFVGDSITRYQYLSLVYFLRWGSWFRPSQRPNLVRTSKNESWFQYFRRTNSYFAPFEQCDCFRPLGPWNSVHFHELHELGSAIPISTENRHYWDPRRNNSVVYIQAFGSRGSHGHWRPENAMKDDHIWRTSEMWRPDVQQEGYLIPGGLFVPNRPYEWETNWRDTITEYLAKLEPKPEYVVLNAGVWSNDFGNPEFSESVAKALSDNGLKGIWKTTTHGKRPHKDSSLSHHPYHQTDVYMCQLLKRCLDLTWTGIVDAELYWDEVHFLEPVYSHMNAHLLSLIALEAGGFDRYQADARSESQEEREKSLLGMLLSRNQLSEDLMRMEGFNMEPNNVTGFLNVCNYSPLIHASETTGEVSQDTFSDPDAMFVWIRFPLPLCWQDGWRPPALIMFGRSPRAV
jgi:hypothetical protein